MKRTNIKKLALRSTTIKHISKDGLADVAGASGNIYCGPTVVSCVSGNIFCGPTVACR
jgi:hypothetical protein